MSRVFNHSPRYTKNINSPRWKACVSIVRKRQGDCCAECLKLGIATPIDSVHHIVPAEEHASNVVYEQQFYNLNNLVGLCRSHHDEADGLLKKGTKVTHKKRAADAAKEFINRLIGKKE